MQPGEPTSQGPQPDKKPSSRDRDLIEEALRQATPREGGSRGVTFQGDLPAEGAFPGYEVLREVHRGGQGVVYQAIQKNTRRKVAIKVLHGGPFTGSTGRSRFEREVQVLGQLNHPNIVRIHDSGASPDGSFFYVMDYISGRSLDELIADKRPSVEDTLRLFIKICDAINAAHLKGVIHRDIKPANIRVDANGEPVVVDFGLAKIAVPDVMEADQANPTPQLMTLTGQFIGSLPWASPEQAEGLPGNIDVRTDVYSLGVMLYQMLTGQFPYKVIGNMRDILDNILRQEPARPSTVRRQINDEVETIVLKCLSKDRERRYQSAGDLGRDLKRYLEGKPIEAKRDSAAYVLGKTLQRYRGRAAAGVAFVALLLVSAIVLSVLYRQASRSDREARDALGALQKANEETRLQAARATANFHAGHDLAMVLLDDIEHELQDLRGATRAREMVLKQAQAYLDRLKTEAGDDPSLLLDLARAHERVGDLQGELYMRKLGDTAGAEQHYAAAREIREALLARLPADARVNRAIAQSRSREGGLATLRRDWSKARAAYESSVASYDRALDLARSDPSLAPEMPRWADGRAWALRALGDTRCRQSDAAAAAGDLAAARTLLQEAEADFARAEQVWREALAARPDDLDAARALIVIRDHRFTTAMASARAMAAGAASLAASAKPDEAFAQYESALARLEQARGLARSAADDFRALSEEHNADGRLRRDLWLAVYNAGLTHAQSAEYLGAMAAIPGHADLAPRETGAHEAALALAREAEGIARPLANSDTASLESLRDLAAILARIAAELKALKRWEDAAAALRESDALRDRIAQADPIQRHQYDLALSRLRGAQFHLDWSDALSGPDRDARLSQARALVEGGPIGPTPGRKLEGARELFGRLQASGAIAPDDKNLKETAAILTRITQGGKERGGS